MNVAFAAVAALLRPAVLAWILASVVAAQQPSRDVAVGVFPFLIGNLDPQITRVLDDCVANDVDTVYVSVFRATGPRTGDLWITDRAGTWNPAWGSVRRNNAGVDLVGFISAAHARDLRVVGVLKCFDNTVQPTHQGHKDYLLDVVDYLVDSYDAAGRPVYDLDGLALDYIRFVGSGTGNDPTLVTNFVADVKARLGVRSLHAYLIANRFTFHGPSYTGSFNSYGSVINTLASQYGQHWEQLARHLDVLMPMAYTADGSIYNTYAGHQNYVYQTALYADIACAVAGFPLRRVTPVVKTYTSSGETTTAQTVEASITGALLGGGDGYQSFRWGTTQASWWAKMKAWAVADQNWPVPGIVASAQSVTAGVDSSTSRDGDGPRSGLEVRYDWGNDGTPDTGWLPLGASQDVLRNPGTWKLGVEVRDPDGHVSATTRRLVAGDPLRLAANTYRAGAGGPLFMFVDGGPATAGHTYLVLGTFSGTSPGTPWAPGFLLPLQLDGLSEALLAFVNTPVLQNGLGTLDASGRATAIFSVPGGLLSGIAFQTIHWSVAVADPSNLPSFVGNAEAMVIVP